MRQAAAQGVYSRISDPQAVVGNVDTDGELRSMRAQMQEERTRREQLVVEQQTMIS